MWNDVKGQCSIQKNSKTHLSHKKRKDFGEQTYDFSIFVQKNKQSTFSTSSGLVDSKHQDLPDSSSAPYWKPIDHDGQWYWGWKKSETTTTQDVKNHVNNGIIYQPQLVQDLSQQQ